MLTEFIGGHYRLAYNWFEHVNIDDYKNRGFKYLEIGAYNGANILSFATSYGVHEDTKLYCIDPWEDYEDYPEYGQEQTNNYERYMKNLENSGVSSKITTIRGYSNIEVPKFEDNFLILFTLMETMNPNMYLKMQY